jgi:hypothetical protein
MRVRVSVGHAVFGVAFAATVLSGTAAAHGGAGSTGAAGVLIVVGATVMGGLVAGLSGLWYDRWLPTIPAWAPFAVGGLLVVLGGSLFLSTATTVGTDPAGLLVATLAGGAGVGFAVTGDDWGCSCDADALSTAVFGHRFVEGLVLGIVLDAANGLAVVAGAVVVGHAAVELAVVGRYYRRVDRLRRGFAAIAVITLGFVVGAAAGTTLLSAVPDVLEGAVLAAAGGVLLALGVSEWQKTGLNVG